MNAPLQTILLLVLLPVPARAYCRVINASAQMELLIME